MVHLVSGDVATAEKLRNGISPLKYKRRNVSAKRDFPRNCGRNSPQINSQSVKDGVVSANGESLKNGQNAPPVNVKPKREAVVSANRTFPRGCGRNALLINAKAKKDGVVSLNRTCPEGCVRNAQLISAKSYEEGISVGSVEELKVETDGAQIEIHSVKCPGISVELGTFEMTENSGQIGSPLFRKALIPQTTNAVKVLKQLETPEPMKDLPWLGDTPKSLDMTGLMNPTKQVELENMGLMKNLNQAELFDSLQNSNGADSKNLLKRASQPEEKELPSSLALLPVDSVLPETRVELKISDQPQASDHVEVVENNMRKKYPPRRRISACRDFPPLCSINTQCSIIESNSYRDIGLSNEKASGENVGEHIVRGYAKQKTEKIDDEVALESRLQGNIIVTKTTGDGFQGNSLGAAKIEMIEHVYGSEVFESRLKQEDFDDTSLRSALGNIESQSDLKSPSSSEKVDRESESSGEKLGMESVKFSKGISLKRKFPEKSVDESCTVNQYQMQEYVADKIDDTDAGDDNDVGVTCNKVRETLPLVQMSHNRDLSLIPFGLHPLVDNENDNEAGVTRKRVRETLRLFQGIFRKLLQDAESKSKDVQANGSGRVDLLSAKILKQKNKCVNTGKKILGPVPGVEVGDEFHYRVELAIIGLHGPYQGGIDFVKRNGKILATSVVASGGYADVMDSSDVLVYSGQGGIPTSKNKKVEDQKLERGNLSLKNSIDERTPVRVIHGFKETKGNDSSDSRGKGKGKVVATYIYDGLYLVERYWKEKGSYGTQVFKFQLKRIPGQPELAIKEVKKSKKSRIRVGLCVDDISQGKEKMPISAINTQDDEKPPLFEYIMNMIYPSRCNLMPPEGCGCPDGCSDSEKCVCAMKNGGEIPYNHDGAIVEAKPLVYECGPSCKCPPSCHNRVTQHGIKFQLEIFKTKSRGWGVRSLNSIPSGSFICEYTGELLDDKEAERRTSNDEYLFDIGKNYNDPAHNCNEPVLWKDASNLIPLDSTYSSFCESMEDAGFTIDAAYHGSVGRFINHSCSPNLYAQNVLYDHDDKSMPHIMLFAAENIPPLQELTYHYNYELDQVHDSDGNIKKKNCYCGSRECTGRMY